MITLGGILLIVWSIFFVLITLILRKYWMSLTEHYVAAWRAEWYFIAATTAATTMSAVTFMANIGYATYAFGTFAWTFL